MLKFWQKFNKKINITPIAVKSNRGIVNVPKHIAIIMDGNGRFAQEKNLPRQVGHRAGAKNLKEITKKCCELGVKYLTVYAFSTENWRRPQNEVTALMDLFVEFFRNYDEELRQQDIRLRFTGDIPNLPVNVQETIAVAEEKSKNRRRMQLIIAFNYGGRREILYSLQNIIRNNLELIKDPAFDIKWIDELQEEDIAKQLYLPDVVDPELIIRTGGAMRLSNFLLWQSAYSELISFAKYWPDFTGDDLVEAIEIFNSCDRKFGGIKDEN